eukprot:scaffold465312_cov29-Prasinocladus_malaysianus.AAC.1
MYEFKYGQAAGTDHSPSAYANPHPRLARSASSRLSSGATNGEVDAMAAAIVRTGSRQPRTDASSSIFPTRTSTGRAASAPTACGVMSFSPDKADIGPKLYSSLKTQSMSLNERCAVLFPYKFY